MTEDPPKRFPNWSWAGASVFAIALCLGLSWGTALVMSASARTPPIAGETGDLLNSIGGVLAGAVTAYIGGQIGAKRQKAKTEMETPADDLSDEKVD